MATIKKFIHEHPDFKSLLEITAQEKNNIDPYLVEKDYWIMHCLWALEQIGLHYHLKGGTSLSKGYLCIHRFSEDIDIKILPEEDICGFKVYSGKNQNNTKQIESRKRYFDWLQTYLAKNITELTDITRDTAFDDPDYRNGGIRLHYKSHFAAVPGLKEGILLEIGFDKTTPNQPRDISSWALDTAFAKGVSVRDNRALHVHCYEPRFTFVEKLQAVIKKFRQHKSGQQNTANLPKNFIRHYYDLYQLLERQDVQDFIGTDEYELFKKERFKSDDTKISNSDALILSDPKNRALFEKEYDRSGGLYYLGRPTLDEILKRFSLYLDRL